MFRFPFVIVALFATSSAHGACSLDLPRAEYASCLVEAEKLSSAELASYVEALVESIATRPGVFDTQRARWQRSLREAQSSWLRLRNQECQELAPFELQSGAKTVIQRRAETFTDRLACILRANEARKADLAERYPNP